MELFLSVKIRSDEEIDCYNEDFFKLEKMELLDAHGFDLVDMIKDCIEKLMQMQDHTLMSRHGLSHKHKDLAHLNFNSSSSPAIRRGERLKEEPVI